MSDKPLHLFDARTAERNISRGLITREEYEAFLGEAEDCSDNAIDVHTRFTYSQGAPEQEIIVTKDEVRATAEQHAAMHRKRIGAAEPAEA
jgi:hypothetical protein